VFRKRLQREAHSAGRLQEPHVVPIRDYGEVDGLLYVDMRTIDGTDLRKVLKRFGPMTPARAVAIVRRSPRRSMPRTRAALCTATSSPRTSCPNGAAQTRGSVSRDGSHGHGCWRVPSQPAIRLTYTR
jgi:hypothetical protein